MILLARRYWSMVADHPDVGDDVRDLARQRVAVLGERRWIRRLSVTHGGVAKTRNGRDCFCERRKITLPQGALRLVFEKCCWKRQKAYSAFP
ncbi:MAG: hypothetical protein COX57_11455 [Alphaproteobacteria bacterium CG_4_10_14_0_2_um_filter_63_37]|nr:MAG: hypothetical protein AUJ55_03115 [Proteobacteria bacterium CG1_02_64_396]PJA23912.1 MAG: hypothetical protein COX57_11455 [Alphaproteobacteria bacterium CG_4_10_14_0_2_um_filter_63_37]